MQEVKCPVGDTENFLFKTSRLANCHLISPVHDAAARSDISLENLEEILSSSPQLLDQKDAAGNTPIHWACAHGQLEKVAFLIERGANLTLCNHLGDTPLHRSVWRDQKEVVSLLLEQPIVLTIIRRPNEQGKTTLDLVRSISVGALLQRAEISEDDDDGDPSEEESKSDSESFLYIKANN